MIVGFNDEERIKSLNDILESEKLQHEMKHEFEKYRKLHELALVDRLLTLKNKVHYHNLTVCMNDAMRWLKMVDNVDKRKKYKEKTAFEYTQSAISELLDETIKITKIYASDYDSSAYNVYFECHGLNFEITIPMVEKITTRNMEYLSYGKIYVGFCETENVVDYVVSSYDENEVRKSFKKFVNDN